jgi:hypothetical protein
MARVSRDDVWDAYCMGEIDTCYCCNKSKLVKNDANTWHRGHILGDRYGGPGILMNLRPLCVKCNRDSKPYATTYGYMAHIKKLLPDEAYEMEQSHRQQLSYIMLSDSQAAFHCIAITEKGTKCTLNKYLLHLCCKKHHKQEKYHIATYIRKIEIECAKEALELEKLMAEEDLFF